MDSLISPTPLSLLERLQGSQGREAWERFVELYTPLLYAFVRRNGMAGDEARDVLQEVFLHLWRKLPEFHPAPDQRFRGWLWTVVRNKVVDYRRKTSVSALKTVAAACDQAEADDGADFVEAEYRAHLVAAAMRIIRRDFDEKIWQACWAYVAENKPAAQVAVELGLSVDSVYQAKVRVLTRLREELKGLVD